MTEDLVVTIKRAAELLGGDKPISPATVRRMIRDGILTARGQGTLRRVTMQSIRDYVEGVTEWHGKGESAGPAKSPMTARPNSTSRGPATASRSGRFATRQAAEQALR
jgi:hypothetical protein